MRVYACESMRLLGGDGGVESRSTDVTEWRRVSRLINMLRIEYSLDCELLIEPFVNKPNSSALGSINGCYSFITEYISKGGCTLFRALEYFKRKKIISMHNQNICS